MTIWKIKVLSHKYKISSDMHNRFPYKANFLVKKSNCDI